RVRIAGGLRPLDLLAQRRRPLAPREEAALVQGERHGKRLRFPRLAEDRTVRVVRDARERLCGRGIDRHVAGSRYGSKASIETLTVGSAPGPHNCRPSNTTV